jgi:hypothetical protein
MDQCSEYIAKLEGYRKNNVMYRRKNESAAWGRSIQKFIEQELTEFYTNFDSTFTIVSKFIVLNSNCYRTYRTQRWRAPKYRIRIVALIRLELRIAQNCYFLRYSVSTIYNYARY